MDIIGKMRFGGTLMPFYTEFDGLNPVRVRGHYSLLIETLAEKFNYQYEIKLTDSPMEFGAIYGEGNGTGMMGFLVKNESDALLFTMTPSRNDFQFIDYSDVANEEDFFIVSSKSTGKFVSSEFAFSQIFSSSVWLASGVSFIVFAIFWNLAERFLSRNNWTNRSGGGGGRFLDTYAIALNQGVDLPPSRLGYMRLAVFGWMVVCFLLNCAFSGCLLSKLTLPPQPIRIDKIKDILDYPTQAVLVLKNTAMEDTFKGSINEVERRIWERIVRMDSSITLDDLDYADLFEQVSKGKTITFVPVSVLTGIVPIVLDEDVVKNIYISKESAFKALLAFPMRKRLHPGMNDLFKRTVRTIFEAGFVARSVRIEGWKNGEIYVQDPEPPKKLQLSSIKVVSYGLLSGMAISTVILIFEFKYSP